MTAFAHLSGLLEYKKPLVCGMHLRVDTDTAFCRSRGHVGAPFLSMASLLTLVALDLLQNLTILDLVAGLMAPPAWAYTPIAVTVPAELAFVGEVRHFFLKRRGLSQILMDTILRW